MYTLGFMQGRLSPQVDGKIQAFPWLHWQQEFELAHAHDWQVMEWTIDQERFMENPLMTQIGQAHIKKLMRQYEVIIPSVTADFVMQAPFYKSTDYDILLVQLKHFLTCAAEIGIKYIVIPLVDNGSLQTELQESNLRRGLDTLLNLLEKNQQNIIFESDFNPQNLLKFIEQFHKPFFGINYDAGNSAALGYDVIDEFATYGSYIKNIHIKDRVYQGSTVPLGKGNVQFDNLFQQLAKINYQGNLIFQTARAEDHYHIAALNQYRNFIKRAMQPWI